MKMPQHQTSDYAELASLFYDLSKPIGGDYPDIPYYQSLLGKKEKHLEIGAGTGRLCIPLLQSGFKVESLECSHSMIYFLNKNLTLWKTQSIIHKMRAEQMTFNSEFDSIIVSFGSFQLFSDLNLAHSCLQKFKRALKKGGRLFIDLDVIRPEPHKAGLKTYGTTLHPDPSEDLVLEGSRTWDFVAQTENIHLRYELWKKGKLQQTELQNFSLRWYGVWEFEAFLKSAGFSKIEKYSDYGDFELSPDVQTFNYVAEI